MAVSEKDFKKELESKVKLVNKTLGRISRRRGLIGEELREPVRYVLEGAGKRIRGAIVLWCCELIEGKINHDAETAAAAIEMVHTYSLIHDDLPAMDDDDYRRGRLTCHKKYDEATAILVGDALLTLAFELLAEEVDKPTTAVRLIKELSEAAGPAGMVVGQMADLRATNTVFHRGERPVEFREFPGQSPRNPKGIPEGRDRGEKNIIKDADLGRIHVNKTAKMFRCAAGMGGICGGASEKQLRCLREFGLKLGLGFQIADDILDVCGTSEELGKTSGKDARQGKATYPAVVGMEESKRLAGKMAGEAVAAIKPFDKAQGGPFGEKADMLRYLTRALLNRNK